MSHAHAAFPSALGAGTAELKESGDWAKPGLFYGDPSATLGVGTPSTWHMLGESSTVSSIAPQQLSWTMLSIDALACLGVIQAVRGVAQHRAVVPASTSSRPFEFDLVSDPSLIETPGERFRTAVFAGLGVAVLSIVRMPEPQTIEPTGWTRAVETVRSSPELRESLLRSVMSSMELEGFEVDRQQSERLLDEALDGPPLVYPGSQ